LCVGPPLYSPSSTRPAFGPITAMERIFVLSRGTRLFSFFSRMIASRAASKPGRGAPGFRSHVRLRPGQRKDDRIYRAGTCAQNSRHSLIERCHCDAPSLICAAARCCIGCGVAPCQRLLQGRVSPHRLHWRDVVSGNQFVDAKVIRSNKALKPHSSRNTFSSSQRFACEGTRQSRYMTA